VAVTTPLGVKRICPSCNARFYDLNKNPARCPKCNHSYDPTVQPRARRARRVASESPLESQDLLIQHMAKTKGPLKKKSKEDEIDDFDDGIAPAVEEDMDDMDDIEQLEELDDIEETSADDEDEEVSGPALIDDVDEEIQAEEAELAAEEAAETTKRSKKKAAVVAPVKKKKK
jgi:uncharacterized protein (TIGR02300 family)